MDRLIPATVLLLVSFGGAHQSWGQDLSTRFGFGAGAVVNPSNREITDDDLGLDLRFRISQPLNGRVSLTAGVGVFVFSSGESREYVLNPQVSLIVTLRGEKRFPYLMAGVGGLFPDDQNRDGQLTVHAGYGWAWPFGTRASFFAELNPMVAFREEGVALMVPVRGGLIF